MFIASIIKPYPNKSILEDVLLREGVPNMESFTPYNGMHHILTEQIPMSQQVYNIQDLLRGTKDFSATKAKPTSDTGSVRDYKASEVLDYFQRLEDIDESYIEKYVTEVLIGFKLNATGRAAVDAEYSTYGLLRDDEEGTAVDPNYLVQEVQEYSIEQISAARRKLPFLLKQLHIGSIEKKGSLMSFIIAASRLKEKLGDDIKPSQIVQEGVYVMRSNGELGGRFSITDNTNPTFRDLFAWIRGDVKDIYYKAYSELVEVLKILQVDITKENPLQFTKSFMDKVVCKYVLSNEEYIETYGFIDKKIQLQLSTDNLFKVKNTLQKASELIYVDDNPQVLFECLISNGVSPSAEMVDRRHWLFYTTLLLKCWKKWDDSTVKVYLSSLRESKGFFRDASGSFIFIPVNEFFTEEKGFVVLTSRGLVVRYLARVHVFEEIPIVRFLKERGNKAIYGKQTIV